jgi:hypothetical protein
MNGREGQAVVMVVVLAVAWALVASWGIRQAWSRVDGWVEALRRRRAVVEDLHEELRVRAKWAARGGEVVRARELEWLAVVVHHEARWLAVCAAGLERVRWMRRSD